MPIRFAATAAAVFAAIATITTPAFSSEYEPALRALAEEQLMGWMQNEELTAAIIAQNAEHAGLSDADIEALDQDWRAGVDGGATGLIDEVLSRPSSQHLQSIQEESAGLVTEVFVMDNRGLNVAQSGITSDYWQGDEAKWQKTYSMGSGAMHFGDVEFDESTQTYQTQLSMAVTDPATNEVIGAVTFGIDVGYLE